MQTTMEPEAIGLEPRCQTCGSPHVVKDAWACFNPDYGRWEIETTFDRVYCHDCQAHRDLSWEHPKGPATSRIRELNDRFRREGRGNGSVVVTSGVQALGAEATLAIIDQVRRFDAFDEANDPWGEHDFGAIEFAGEKVFFKLDYYNPDLTAGSENPANEGLTHRVLTVMLACEY